ncbi:MAG: DUF4199 domain-containing protein [Opitutaceae bacterium]|nr:DUF4199 domain-containing protein [Opitutaceae bacterium]
MKIPLTYGAIMAVAAAVLTLLLYFAGLHDNPEKFGTGQLLGVIGGLAVGITCLALAIREKRANHPVTSAWGYGSALGGGVLTGLVASVLGIATGYLYFAVIHPGFGDLVLQVELAKLEGKGVPASAIAQAEGMIKFMTRPGMMIAMQAIVGFFWTVVLSLIIAIFFRRRAADTPPLIPAQ